MSLKNPLNNDTGISVERGTSLSGKGRFGYFTKCLFFEVLPTAFATQKYHSFGVWSIGSSQSRRKPNPKDLLPFAHLSKVDLKLPQTIWGAQVWSCSAGFTPNYVWHTFLTKLVIFNRFLTMVKFLQIKQNASRLFKCFCGIISLYSCFFFNLHTLKQIVDVYRKNSSYVLFYKMISSH